MNRYISSFILSALSYLTIITLIIYFLSADTKLSTEAKLQDVRKVCFTVVAKTTPPKPKEKKKVEPKPKPKPKPKPIPEPIKEEPTPKPIVEEKIVEEIVEEVEEVVEETTPQEEVLVEQQPEINQDLLLAKQNKFINDLIKKINDNKSYPRMARRRGIEGLVDVKFKILSDGSVDGIKVVSGRGIFKRSAMEAISKSFPVVIEEALFSFPKEFKVKISYVLN
jgi:protein TonB